METKIIEFEKIDLKNPVLIEGLPGIGLIGKIAAEYLISELKAKKFAYLYSPYFPHQVIIEKDSKIRLIRDEFYYHRGKKDLIILTGDTQVPPTNSYGHYEVVQKILDFLEAHGAKEIYTLGGYSTGGKEVKEPRVLSSGVDKKLIKKFSNIDPFTRQPSAPDPRKVIRNPTSRSLNRKETFMKRFILILLFSVFTVSSLGQTNWFQGSFEQAQQKAEKDGKLILTFFYSPL